MCQRYRTWWTAFSSHGRQYIPIYAWLCQQIVLPGTVYGLYSWGLLICPFLLSVPGDKCNSWRAHQNQAVMVSFSLEGSRHGHCLLTLVPPVRAATMDGQSTGTQDPVHPVGQLMSRMACFRPHREKLGRCIPLPMLTQNRTCQPYSYLRLGSRQVGTISARKYVGDPAALQGFILIITWAIPSFHGVHTQIAVSCRALIAIIIYDDGTFVRL